MYCLHVYNFSRLKYLLVLFLVIIQAACSSGSSSGSSEVDVINILGVTWVAPILREDNSPLSSNISYRIYYGTEAGDYQNRVDVNSGTNAQINDLPSGTYYLVVTAIDADGRESLYSPEVAINL